MGVLHGDSGDRAADEVGGHAHIAGHHAADVGARVDRGTLEGDILHRSVQHAGEAGVRGLAHREVGNGMARAVEVDEFVVRLDIVQRRPLDAVHVDVGIQLGVPDRAGCQVAGQVAQLFRRLDDPGGDLRALAAGIVGVLGFIGPAAAGEGEQVHHARLQRGCLREQHVAAQELVVAAQDDVERRAGRHLRRIPGGVEPGRQDAVFRRAVGQVELELVRLLLLAVALVEEGRVGGDGDRSGLCDSFGHLDRELQDTGLLEGAGVLRGPCRVEGEGEVVVDILERRLIAEVREAVVALLGLDAPVLFDGVLAGIEDREGLALHGLADELGLLGRESFLDLEDLRGLTDDGDLVAGIPGPGKLGLQAGAARGGRVGQDGADGHQIVRTGHRVLDFLAAGEDEGKERKGKEISCFHI